MAAQFLHRANVVAAFEQMRGKRMAQCVRRYRLVDAGGARGDADSPLHGLVLHMMATHHPGARIDRQSGRRKNVLPHPFATRLRILAIQREGQIHLAMPRDQVLPMQLARRSCSRKAGTTLAGSMVTRSLAPLPPTNVS